jgi:C4-dicarboxylate transporter
MYKNLLPIFVVIIIAIGTFNLMFDFGNVVDTLFLSHHQEEQTLLEQISNMRYALLVLLPSIPIVSIYFVVFKHSKGNKK